MVLEVNGHFDNWKFILIKKLVRICEILKIMDTPITHINLFNAMLALYVIGYQISICSDWSWIPMNKEDYQLPYQDKWSRTA